MEVREGGQNFFWKTLSIGSFVSGFTEILRIKMIADLSRSQKLRMNHIRWMGMVLAT